MRRSAIAVVFLLFAAPAWPRDADGRLGLLVLPNDTRPALVLRGEAFVVVARARAKLTLISTSAAHPVSIIWAPVAGGLVRGTCNLPPDVPPGPLTLEAINDTTTDRNARSVFVYDAFPESYSFAHLSHLRIDSGSEASLDNALLDLDGPGFSFVLVTGELTEDGTAGQIAQALSALADIRLPTFVCPGHAEMASGLAEDYFGPMPFTFRFGADGYLGHYLPQMDGPDISGRAGKLHRLRRSIRASRWSVGFLNAYGPEGATRDQLVLFRDDPLDYVISAEQASGPGFEFNIPWGKTVGFGSSGRTRTVQAFELSPVRLQLMDTDEEQ